MIWSLISLWLAKPYSIIATAATPITRLAMVRIMVISSLRAPDVEKNSTVFIMGLEMRKANKIPDVNPTGDLRPLFTCTSGSELSMLARMILGSSRSVQYILSSSRSRRIFLEHVKI